jgi:GT2 family glycosyltransferase
MKLSVIVVNYNVCALLRQSLNSIIRACAGTEHEIFVVDNASADHSVAMLKREFPNVNLIANDKNIGFAAANNQALAMATGDYVVLINPDTITTLWRNIL